MFNMDIGIGSIVEAGAKLFKSYFPPDLTPEQKAQLEAGAQKFQTEITSQLIDYNKSIIKSQKEVIVAEAQGEGYLQRNWRPITMLVFVFIVANNYIIVPYMSALFSAKIPTLELTQNMWDLLKLGIGGYIAGRSIEKAVKSYKGN